jgi:hypothetical protein
VTPAEVTENLPMLELLFRSRFPLALAAPLRHRGRSLRGTVENVAPVEQ